MTKTIELMEHMSMTDDSAYRNPLMDPTPESLELVKSIIDSMSPEQIASLLAGMQTEGPPPCVDT